MTSITNFCSIENCSKTLAKKSWCMMHYTRWNRYGDPLFSKYERRGKTNMGEYKSWQMMKERCYTKNVESYHRYGGRGITVCDRWHNSFKNFLKDMGERPAGHSIERIDNNGNYEPSNCRWATRQEQASNRRSNRNFTLNGETKTLKRWSDFYGRRYKTVWARVNVGYSIEKALGL